MPSTGDNSAVFCAGYQLHIVVLEKALFLLPWFSARVAPSYPTKAIDHYQPDKTALFPTRLLLKATGFLPQELCCQGHTWRQGLPVTLGTLATKGG